MKAKETKALMAAAAVVLLPLVQMNENSWLGLMGESSLSYVYYTFWRF